jgi:Domain of unknown function (DUF4345)
MIIKALKVGGWLVGASLISLGVGRMLFCMTTIPGGGAVNATLDSESRASGALLISVGFGYIWAMRRSPIPSPLLRLLATSMALLVVARVISIIETGLPHPIFVAAAVVELVAAALTYWYSTMRDDQPTRSV